MINKYRIFYNTEIKNYNENEIYLKINTKKVVQILQTKLIKNFYLIKKQKL